MKYKIFLSLLLLLAPSILTADDCTEECVPVPDTPFAVMEAKELEYSGTRVKAAGDVRFVYGNKQMRCDSIDYDIARNVGTAENLSVTTCIKPKPHYRVRCKKVEFTEDGMLKAKHTAVYLRNLKLASLPYLAFRVDDDIAHNLNFPMVGYSNRDGLHISKDFVLADQPRFSAKAKVMVGTKRHLRMDARLRYAFDNTLAPRPGRYFDYEKIYNEDLDINDLFEVYKPAKNAAKPAHLVAELNFMRHQRFYDPVTEDLERDKEPELKLTYTARPISLDKDRLMPNLELYPQIRTSMGRYKETPNTGTNVKSRYNLGFTLPINITNVGTKGALHAVFGTDYYYYSGPDYHKYLYALDYRHAIGDDSLLVVRYVNQTDSGVTPFLFDNIDVRESILCNYIKSAGRHLYGFGANYNIDSHKLYDWQLLYGRKSDCHAWAIVWRNRDHKIGINIAPLNF